MAINKAAVPADAGEKFIARAEGGERAVRWVRGNRAQVTLSIAPDLPRQVDAIANCRHLSRAALITVCLGEVVEKDSAS